jgi:hypothetical protein
VCVCVCLRPSTCDVSIAFMLYIYFLIFIYGARGSVVG